MTQSNKCDDNAMISILIEILFKCRQLVGNR